MVPGQAAFAVETSAEDFPRLKEYWQHAGEILSSRAAELILASQSPDVSETPARITVRQRVADYGGCSPKDVWLFSCGMAAIATVHRTIRTLDPVHPTVQFRFSVRRHSEDSATFSAQCSSLPATRRCP
jgi:cystathionine beta-lyase/cystathionine gamma-synthase